VIDFVYFKNGRGEKREKQKNKESSQAAGTKIWIFNQFR
jgi:hypothetical protein